MGHWSCLGDAFVRCNADGHVGLGLPADQLLVPKCAPGALIGKLDGSVAGREDGTLFVIGSRSLVSLEKKNTFLYIGVNGAVPRATHELESIRLEIFGVPAT